MLQSFHTKGLVEAGCDEAGRGCLAGPVFASAVILPDNFSHPKLNDSKQITEKVRDELRIIIEKQALAWAVVAVSPKEIDEINILNASIIGMHRSLEKLAIKPDHILVDGNRFKPYNFIPHTCIVKGDEKFTSIAAASILAKTHRDEYMQHLHKTYPNYSWNTNKGYPTIKHRAAISDFGTTIHHRLSFKLLKD